MLGTTLLMAAYWLRQEMSDDDAEKANINPLGYQMIETALMGEVSRMPAKSMAPSEQFVVRHLP